MWIYSLIIQTIATNGDYMENSDEFGEYEEPDYYEDIFSPRPNPSLPLIGYDEILDNLIYWVNSGNLIFIEGKEGTGKTSLLYKVIKKFKGQRKVVYLDCQKVKKNINIEKLLIQKYGVMGKFFKILPNEMIVLLDNINFLSHKNAERIKYFFDQNNIKSVIFTGEDSANIPESIKHRIGKRWIRIPRLNKNTATEILFSRIEEIDLMDSATTNKLYTISDYNPKKFLSNCIRVFEYAEKLDKQKIFINDIRLIIDE